MSIVIKAKIYRICSDKGSKVYIGSTTKQYLSNRWAGHTSDYRKKPINCASKELFDEYGIENCRCELIEEVDYQTKEDYLMRERYWIENTVDCINKRLKPFATKEEQRIKKNERSKERYELCKNNTLFMEVKKEQLNAWKEKNSEPILCECGITYMASHKARHLKSKRHLECI
jgi:hypothetical protein